MPIFKGYANLAEKKSAVSYQRPDYAFTLDVQRTGNLRTGDAKSKTISNLFDETASKVLNFPLNKRLELGFRDIQILPDDWDSFGSPAPSPNTVDLAKRVCAVFQSEYQPEIMPERDGSIGLYWEKPHKTIAVFIHHELQNNPKFIVESDEATEEFISPTDIWATIEVLRKVIFE